jgi:hypothetical protein
MYFLYLSRALITRYYRTVNGLMHKVKDMYDALTDRIPNTRTPLAASSNTADNSWLRSGKISLFTVTQRYGQILFAPCPFSCWLLLVCFIGYYWKLEAWRLSGIYQVVGVCWARKEGRWRWQGSHAALISVSSHFLCTSVYSHIVMQDPELLISPDDTDIERRLDKWDWEPSNQGI